MKRLARFMRNVYPTAKTAYLAKRVLQDGGMTIKEAEEGLLCKVITRLQSRRVLDSLKQMVSRICRLTIKQSSKKAYPGLPDTLNVREFTVAYLISCQPAECFENTEDSSAKSIQNVASGLLENFERICNAIGDGGLASVNETDLQSFPKLLSKYMTAYRVSRDVLPSSLAVSVY